MKLTNFKIYTPSDSQVGCLYLICDENIDWYKSQSMFAEDTYKLVINSTGTITSYSKDVSQLFPIDCSIVEVNSLPDDFETGRFKYVDGEVIKKLEVSNVTEVSKAQAKIALLNAGLLDDVDAYFNSESVDRVMLIAWQDAQFFTRSSPFIAAMQQILQLDDVAVDELFLKASEVQL